MNKPLDIEVQDYIKMLEEQLHESERKLYESEKQLRILKGAIDASWFGLSLADSKGNALMVNPAHSRITGSSPSSIVGKNFSEIQHVTNSQSCTLQVLEKDMAVCIIQTPNSGREYMVYGNPFVDPVTGERYVVCNNIDDVEVGIKKQEVEIVIEDTHERELKKIKNLDKKHEEIIFRSSKMENVINLCSTIAPFDATVLLEGESGSGKELLAEYIVANGNRNKKPFIKVNCAAIPDSLLESELFGYEPNSFTNASNKGKRGILEIANHGTVLLDEIGELPLALQAKLLRFVQQREFFRIGGINPIKVDVRIIAATNQNLLELVKEKHFRKDLYYRLCVVPIGVPPFE